MAKRLLLADDSLTIQKVVELILVPEDFEVRAFSDGEQAYGAIEDYRPDVVLADVEMPTLNGYQLCERLKADEHTSRIPIILLVGAFEPFDEEYAKKVGADEVIIKPFESHELINKVKSIIVDYQQEAMAPVKAGHTPASVGTGTTPFVTAPHIGEFKPLEPMEGEADTSEAAGLTAELEELINQVTPSAESALSPVRTEEVPVFAALPEASPIAEASSGHSAEHTRHVVEEKVTAFINNELKTELSGTLKEHVGRAVSEMAPSVVEKVTREVFNDMAEKMRADLEGLIRAALPDVLSSLRESVEKSVSGVAPNIVEKVSRELIEDLMAASRPEIEASMLKVVPGVAEALIKREIDRITSGL